MKFGIALSTFKMEFGGFGRIVFSGKNVKENLITVKELGYDGVDLFIEQMSEGELENLEATINDLELEVPLFVAIFLSEQGVNLSDPNKKNRLESVEKFKKQVKVASVLGSKMPVGFIRGNMKKDELEPVYQERLADSLKELSEYADSKGVKLVLEPINHFEINSFLRVDQSIEFLHKYNLNKIELLIDTFHMNIEEASIEQAIKMAGTKIGHIHITDSNGRAPGDGHLDYKSILKAVKDTGYNGFLSTEAFPIHSPYECGRGGDRIFKKSFSDDRCRC